MSRTRTSITELQTQRDNLERELNTLDTACVRGAGFTKHTQKKHNSLAKKIAELDRRILATIDEPHKAAGTHDDPVRYTHNASTAEGRRRENKANWDAAEKDAKEGKVLCLSDLICSAEAVHIDQIKGGK
mgnify:CR=1 FL=1